MPGLPCDEGNPIFLKWKNGIEKGDPDDTITCKIRKKNVLSEYVPGKHGKKGTVKAPKWNYCYVIKVNFEDGTYTTLTTSTDNMAIDQATGGNGCGSCHADTGF